jgi:hypothetical protein
MFSKAGRFTSEKYIIFQKKDEILFNKRKFLKVASLPELEKLKPNQLLEKKDPLLEFTEKQKKQQAQAEKKDEREKHKKEESQTFFK